MPLFNTAEFDALHNEVLTYQNGPKTRVLDELVDIDEKVLQTAVRGMRLPEPTTVEDDLVRITVDEKMERNAITSEANKDIIYASLCYSEMVGEYIKQRAIDDNDRGFPYRLKTFFRSIYAEFYNNNVRGDDLFDRLVVAVIKTINAPAFYPAVNAIIVHLFEICDLFEKHDTTNEIHSAS